MKTSAARKGENRDADLAAGGFDTPLPIGARVAVPGPAHVALFAEDQARYVVTVRADQAAAIEADAAKAGVPVVRLGETGGEALIVDGALSISVEKLVGRHEDWFPRFMGAPGAA